jgi:hypothetical protein
MGFLKRIRGGNASNAQTGPGSGILAGLFIASEAELAAWNLRRPTPAQWPAVELKWLETVKLGTLEAIVRGVPYDSIDQGSLHNVVRDGGKEGPWVSLVRPDLVVGLAALDPARIREIAANWADTDEWKPRPSDAPDLRVIDGLAGLLPSMTSLAQESQGSGRPMYLLMGL